MECVQPLNPDAYIELLVEPQIRFYQKRLPSYYRSLSAAQYILIIGSLSGTLMAFLEVRMKRSHADDCAYHPLLY